MATPIREMRENGIYHITNRGNNRMPIFRDRQDKDNFLNRLFKLQKKYKFKIIVFCIMDNHFHILIRDEAKMLPVYVGALEDYYAKYFNKKYNHLGHVFQGPFKSYLIRGYLDLLKNFRYIVRNAVAAGISNSIFNYEWTVIDKSSRFIEYVDFSFVEEALLNTGNPNLEKYLEDSVDDIWAHEIECEIRSTDEASEIFHEYIEKAGIEISIPFDQWSFDSQVKTIKYLTNMGCTKEQTKELTKISMYRIENIRAQ
jgi:REP element-mobilizing transposase RayT